MTEDAIFYGLLIIAICLTIMGYIVRRPAIGFAGAGFWLGFALFSYTFIVTTWDIYYLMFWLGIALTITVVLETFVLRPKKADDELAGALDHDSWEDYGEKMERHRDNMERARRPTRRHQKQRREEESDKKKIRKMLS